MICAGCSNNFIPTYVDQARCPGCIAQVLGSLGMLPTRAAIEALRTAQGLAGYRHSVSPGHVLDMLNGLLRLDPAGISGLMRMRYPVHESVLQQSDVRCHRDSDGTIRLGPLGLINGIFGPFGDMGAIVASEPDTDPPGNILKFSPADGLDAVELEDEPGKAG